MIGIRSIYKISLFGQHNRQHHAPSLREGLHLRDDIFWVSASYCSTTNSKVWRLSIDRCSPSVKTCSSVRVPRRVHALLSLPSTVYDLGEGGKQTVRATMNNANISWLRNLFFSSRFPSSMFVPNSVPDLGRQSLRAR